jgi:hypothetical protein
MDFFHMKEIRFRASMSYTEEDFAEVVADFTKGKFSNTYLRFHTLILVAGRYPGVEEMVTSRIQLEDVATQGFEELIQNKDKHIKILVTPKPELLRKEESNIPPQKSGYDQKVPIIHFSELPVGSPIEEKSVLVF